MQAPSLPTARSGAVGARGSFGDQVSVAHDWRMSNLIAMTALETGARGEARLVVSEADTAVALKSGEVPVLGTPRIVALCEEASVRAVAASLDPGTTTVGRRVQLDHLQPTAIGVEVVAEAVLEKVEGRRLIFHVTVHDPDGLVAAGKVTRVVVDLERFLDKLH